MAGGDGGGGGGEGGVALKLEDAVKLLVEHLVEPVLERGRLRRGESPKPGDQEAVARQVHAMVLLYNYFHRKQFPHLDFADPQQFFVSASVATSNALLAYQKACAEAFEDACGIAEALDAKLDSPDTSMWPVSKVAVLLVDPTRKKCLIDYGSVTKGVRSILEKDLKAVSGKSNLSAPAESGPFMLQQAAYSVVESKTGMKGASLRLIEEHLVYSLSKKETTAKLFVMQYEQTVDGNLKEMPIEDLISRMSGPIFRNDAFPETTSVVEYYHILPYKEVLLNLLNRERNLGSSQSIPKEEPLRKGKSTLHSEIAESMKEHEANDKYNIKNTTAYASDQKKRKGMKEVGNSSGTNNRSTSEKGNGSPKKEILKRPRLHPRESEAPKASPKKGNGSLSTPEAETLKLASNAANAQETILKSGALVNVETSESYKLYSSPSLLLYDHLISGDQMDKNKSNGGFENLQTGSIDVNINCQMYASLQSLQKMRDDIVSEYCMLGDRGAQFDMDIQTILTEGKMTPRVISILKKYGVNSSDVNVKRKRLTEAVLSRTPCQELDTICRENNWTLPRYTVLPSLINGLYQATVYLVCPDLEVQADGSMKTTPHEARDSAATAMLHQLHTKAKEKPAEQDSSTPDAVLLDKIPEK